MSALQLVGVYKNYGATSAPVDYSLTVPAGLVTAFVGPHGAGKSTAMRLVAGLRFPDRGSALLDGRPLCAADRERIGLMPEERGLGARQGTTTARGVAGAEMSTFGRHAASRPPGTVEGTESSPADVKEWCA